MKLQLIRDLTDGKRTFGKLFIDGEFVCDTLEDVDRRLESGGVKVPGETAIPLGTYTLTVNQSPRFKRLLPLLLSVPDFSGVRMHPGNSEADTEGCILLGVRYKDRLIDSRLTFNKVFDRIYAEYQRCTITITRKED